MPTLAQNAKSEKRDVKREKSKAKYPAIYFQFFAFRTKSVAGLTESKTFSHRTTSVRNGKAKITWPICTHSKTVHSICTIALYYKNYIQKQGNSYHQCSVWPPTSIILSHHGSSTTVYAMANRLSSVCVTHMARAWYIYDWTSVLKFMVHITNYLTQITVL